MTNESRAILRDLVSFQHGRCAYCGARLRKVARRGPRAQADTTPTIDHMAPQWAGGADEPDNRCAACFHCNNEKGPLDAATYLRVRWNPEALKAARRLAEGRAALVAIPWFSTRADPPSPRLRRAEGGR